MRILLVKLSSLGDVVHNFPVATDIRRAFPHATIDWLTDSSNAALVALHPDIHRVFLLHLRALKSRWWQPSAWGQLFDDKALLAGVRYDLIIDTQGLVKSAVVAHWATGAVAGYDKDSIREPIASKWYTRRFAISRALHAVARNRRLAALALGYEPPQECDYGIAALATITSAPPHSALEATTPSTTTPYVVFCHATSRLDKRWPITSWVALGRTLNTQGYRVLLTSGNENEHSASLQIVQQLAQAEALPAKSIADTLTIFSRASAVVGVDTGLAHLAVAAKRPTVGIYLTTQPHLTGLYVGETTSNPVGETLAHAVNLGGGSRAEPAVVTPENVLQILQTLLPMEKI